jgi:hypothetical protein
MKLNCETTDCKQKTTLIMNTTILVVGAVLFVTITTQVGQSAIVEEVISQGPMTGQIRTINKTIPSPKEVSIPQPESVVTLNVQGRKTNMPVQLIAYRQECTATRSANTASFICYEFQLRAKEGGFVWSSWSPDFPRPHRFQVLTTESGTSYASYIRDGVHLFRLSESRQSDAMRRQFWEAPEDFEIKNPDALPRLAMESLGKALGRTNTEGMGPQTWNISVDNLSDKSGELCVIVHGAAPQPKCTFALRNNKWEFVSTSSK